MKNYWLEKIVQDNLNDIWVALAEQINIMQDEDNLTLGRACEAVETLDLVKQYIDMNDISDEAIDELITELEELTRVDASETASPNNT